MPMNKAAMKKHDPKESLQNIAKKQLVIEKCQMIKSFLHETNLETCNFSPVSTSLKKMPIPHQKECFDGNKSSTT